MNFIYPKGFLVTLNSVKRFGMFRGIPSNQVFVIQGSFYSPKAGMEVYFLSYQGNGDHFGKVPHDMLVPYRDPLTSFNIPT